MSSSGRVLDPKSDSDRALAAFNDHVAADPRVRQVILTVRDGVMLVPVPCVFDKYKK